jgi:hypothetical protein
MGVLFSILCRRVSVWKGGQYVRLESGRGKADLLALEGALHEECCPISASLTSQSFLATAWS